MQRTPFHSAVLDAARSNFDWNFWESTMKKIGKWWEEGEMSYIDKEWEDFCLMFADALDDANIFPLTAALIHSGKFPEKFFSERDDGKTDLWIPSTSIAEDMFKKVFFKKITRTLRQLCVKVEYYLMTT